jgi:hypothetical protein
MVEQDFYIDDFAEWAALAGSDPDAFERLRQGLIDGFIQNSPPESRQRLLGLQWRIDQERARSRSPVGACIRITRMMWERLTGPGGLAEHLRRLGDDVVHLERAEHPDRPPPKPAKVLKFARRTD